MTSYWRRLKEYKELQDRVNERQKNRVSLAIFAAAAVLAAVDAAVLYPSCKRELDSLPDSRAIQPTENYTNSADSTECTNSQSGLEFLLNGSDEVDEFGGDEKGAGTGLMPVDEIYHTPSAVVTNPPAKPRTKYVPLDAKRVSSLPNNRGVRNHNPGNLRATKKRWMGQTGVDKDGFCVFNAPEYGIRAIMKQLKKYESRGWNTLRNIVYRWAHPSENDTNAYLFDVSKLTGFHPDARIDLSNATNLVTVADAIATRDSGAKYHPELFDKAYQLHLK